MRKQVVIALFLVLLLTSGCAALPSSGVEQYEYNYRESSVADSEETSEALSESETQSEVESEEPSTTDESNSTAAPETSSEKLSENQTEESHETQTRTNAETKQTEVDLNISMPEKNGTMVTDTAADNKFIEIVAEDKGIEKKLLVAVYAVPESGQNYVFEFYDEKSRDSDDIRRVYLIDENGKITGVAAADSSERVGIGSMENWFSMNVLIKEVIYPAVKDSIVSR